MADLSKLSDADLLALKLGDITKVSDAGLLALKGEAAPSSFVDRALDGLKGPIKGVLQGIGDFEAGKIRGAASIGATLMRPFESGDENKARRAKVDEFMQSMGAQPDSMAYGAGKIGAEIAGTAGAGNVIAGAARLIPGVAANAPRVVNALQSAGMTTGVKAAPGAGNALADLAIRSGAGAVTGGGQAALVDPEHALTGAVVGGALPGAAKGLGIAGRAIGAQIMPNRNALNKIAETGDPNQIIADIQTYYPKGAENIPASAAAITKNPALAQLEQGSRLKTPAPWYDFDQKQGKAVYENVMNATKDAELVGQRAATRRSNWDEAWAKARDNEKPKLWQWGMQRLRMDLDQALMSPPASNPAVKAAIDQIRNEIDRLGPGFSPSHLQQLRAELNGKINPLDSTLSLKTAPRDNPAIISIKQELDRILNASTGGKWQKVLDGYVKDSVSLTQARASEKVRSKFIDNATGNPLRKGLDPNDEIPIITESGLKGAINMARNPDKTLGLSDEAVNRLQATVDALRRQGIVQDVKRTATAGGGSDTMSNAIAAAGGGKMGAAWRLLKGLGTMRTDAELARMLSNPDALAAELRKLAGRRGIGNPLAELTYRAAPGLAGGQ
jgi:hypothetical protein